MANGLRTSPYHILTEEEIEGVKKDAESIGIPLNVLQFNVGNQTGFSDECEVIHIRGDILPDFTSNILRDNLSQRAVLAHEYYGHYKHNPSTLESGTGEMNLGQVIELR